MRVPEPFQQPLPLVEPPVVEITWTAEASDSAKRIGHTHRDAADEHGRAGRADRSEEAPPQTASSETQSTSSRDFDETPPKDDLLST